MSADPPGSDDQAGAQPIGAPDPGFDELDAAAQEKAGVTASGEPVRLRLRRAPKYRAFGVSGGLIGVVVGLILALSHPAVGEYSGGSIAGYLAVSLGLFGGVVGLGLALLFERRRQHS